jgi:DNA invertase Pin-like site-specific DNA recombinase
MAFVGYARTSTLDQKAGLEAQVRDLKNAGCIEVFSEEISSVAKQRLILDECLRFLRKGDTLIVTKIDRLARSTADLLKLVQRLQDKEVAIRFLSSPELDTGSPNGKLMLAVLGAIAEFERDLMLERQREGIAKAKLEGKYKGRAPTARRQQDRIISMRANGMTAKQVADELGVSVRSVFRVSK